MTCHNEQRVSWADPIIPLSQYVHAKVVLSHNYSVLKSELHADMQQSQCVKEKGSGRKPIDNTRT
ncbi:MAG: hypothetical protein NPIRA02_09350 [Nitrospirales bacterium]|nr:MAG: hypothetical protein NPIRA02_09350 [Nitrospirales bacterium]